MTGTGFRVRGTPFRVRGTLAASAALALSAGVLLAGCSGAGDPTSSSTSTVQATSSAPTASQTPSATAAALVYKPATAQGPAQNVPVPELPEAAKEFSKAGLEEFARYWYSTLSYAYETGDSKPMMAITSPDCKTCSGASKTVTNWYEKGGWIEGARMTVHSSNSKFFKTPEGSFQAIVMIQQGAGSFYNADMSLAAQNPAGIVRPDIVVATYTDGKWTAQQAEHLTKE